MGQALLRALDEGAGTGEGIGGGAGAGRDTGEDRLRLCGAVASAESDALGADAGRYGPPRGVTVTADAEAALAGAAVAVDFSVPGSVAEHARACAQAGVPLLVGVTGFDATAQSALESAAAAIPVLIAPNTSVGVNVIARLVQLATRALGLSFDVEISESHHRLKRDAPSGTALALGRVVAGARRRTLEEVAVYDRHGRAAERGAAERMAGEIGFAVLRAGDIVGEHTVMFAGAGERVEIRHCATDRITFARGALRAAEWLRSRPPGLYSMEDVLGFEQP
jgi:4-hydroxy-tetrahydrodipicolinate reductase